MKFCNKTVRNELIMAPMTTCSSNSDLTVSDEELKYYARRAKNFGTVITATTFTIRRYQGFPNQFYAGDDSHCDSLKSLSKAIKDNGALAILQVFLPGRTVDDELASQKGIEVVSASSVVSPRADIHTTPNTLTDNEITEIINSFYDTVKRAIKCGFDGVEIHGANTYLLQQFVSKHSNQRDDNWGGTPEKRLNFSKAIVEISLKAKNELNANDFIIGYRFSPEESHQPGITLSDTYQLIDYLCSTDIDYLHVSLGKYDATSVFDDKVVLGKVLSDYINNRKPLIGVGSIFSKSDIEKAKSIGFDYVAIGASAIINPDFISNNDNELKYPTAFTNLEQFASLDVPKNMATALISRFNNKK